MEFSNGFAFLNIVPCFSISTFKSEEKHFGDYSSVRIEVCGLEIKGLLGNLFLKFWQIFLNVRGDLKFTRLDLQTCLHKYIVKES